MAINDFFLKIFDTNEDKIISFNEILGKIDGVVWGIPTIVLILVTGLILTIRCRGIQFTKLGRAFKQIFKKNEGEGELSGFSALCTALSATIGTGNIVGVATAIAMGGHVRVGFEDNLYLEKGVLAKSNGELVAKVVRLAKELGREVATSAEAREILSLKPRK